ncbi:unnamed protein product, partial [Didymodactylos carnosus]
KRDRDREPINEKEKTPTSTTSLQTSAMKFDNKIKPSTSSLIATLNTTTNNNNNINDLSVLSSIFSETNHDLSLLSSNLTGAASELLSRRGSANTLLNFDSSKKINFIDSPTIDLSRSCRFLFPDSTSTIIPSSNCNHITIQQAINRLFAKRGITWYRCELYIVNSDQTSSTEKESRLSE